MKVIIRCSLVVAVIITASALWLEHVVNNSDRPRLVVSEKFTVEQRAVILSAGKEWQDKFGLSKVIYVTTCKGEVVASNGWTYSTMEISMPGLILIDPSGISGEKDLRNIVLHSFSHAEAGKTVLPVPLDFSDGQIIGYRGAAIMVRLKSGEKTFWTKLEEGICDRNAFKVNDRYSVQNASYFAVGKKAISDFSDMDLVPYIRSNNFPALVGIILNKDPSKITVDDILAVMRMYQTEWKKGDKSRQ